MEMAGGLLKETCQANELHTHLRALGISSDFARIIDGITTQCGETLLVHVPSFTTRSGSTCWRLLDLTPQVRCTGGILLVFHVYSGGGARLRQASLQDLNVPRK